MSVLPENWHTWYLEDTDFDSEIICLNFQTLIHFCANLGRKIQRCLFCPNICTKSISRMLLLIPTLVFRTFDPNFFFGQIFENLEILKFLKITRVVLNENCISRMLILIWTLVFWASKPKPPGCWFLFWQNFCEISNLNPFFGQILVEMVELSTLPGNCPTEHLEDVIARITRKFWKQIKKWIIVVLNE